MREIEAELGRITGLGKTDRPGSKGGLAETWVMGVMLRRELSRTALPVVSKQGKETLMDLIRRAFNLKNAAILLGVAFAVSGIVSTIVHGVLADEVIT